MRSRPPFLWGPRKLTLVIAFALSFIFQVAHNTSCIGKHNLLISIIDPSCSPFRVHICSGCFHLEPQRYLAKGKLRNFHGHYWKVEMKSQICTLHCDCYRTTTAAQTPHWKYRSITRIGCFQWRVHQKISCFPSASTFFIFSLTFIKLVQEKNVLNLSSGYRHFIWSLHRNPK